MYPIDYIDPVFRPPSEARSLILQVTNGCSWNQCTFCEMYTAPQKRFQPQPMEALEQQLQSLASAGYPVRRVFLADGDAMALSVRRLKEILTLIRHYYPDVQRISSYCLPRNLKKKSVQELAELKELGLSLMYVGCESGDNDVLTLVEKGESFDSSLEALSKIKSAGMKSSVMILNGLGGEALSHQHAANSARLMNAAQPDYLSTLVVSFPMGDDRYQENFKDSFVPLTQQGLFSEMKTLLQTLELQQTIFRSDHASNYLVLKGVLGKDKAAMLEQVDLALNGRIALRQEWQRGL
ncbi:radical SAM protein [Aestuariicella hydrocarbonica]|uniref:Radical SAM protein n=1 Tax=Pseudomaricurvus hydrocarbonicus TaxID=1470433 RepID=A0A9E5JUK1_9GAMM|nr:radical SAM protein [Aestuariicella hydrocarbonica]NHO64845.1 radical SAM protein [Aestuariicella hydrocarbonica]